MLYLQSIIKEKEKIEESDISYFFKNIFSVDVEKATLTECTNKLNDLRDAKNRSILKPSFYGVTTYIFDNIICTDRKYDNKEFVYKYLTDMMVEFERVFNDHKYRIIYYAYTPEEIEFFKEKYDVHTIFIGMSHKLQSQLLLKNGLYDKADEIVKSSRIESVEKMRKMSDLVINNELEMDNKIVSKIMSYISI
jgi:hypothetical protein